MYISRFPFFSFSTFNHYYSYSVSIRFFWLILYDYYNGYIQLKNFSKTVLPNNSTKKCNSVILLCNEIFRFGFNFKRNAIDFALYYYVNEFCFSFPFFFVTKKILRTNPMKKKTKDNQNESHFNCRFMCACACT